MRIIKLGEFVTYNKTGKKYKVVKRSGNRKGFLYKLSNIASWKKAGDLTFKENQMELYEQTKHRRNPLPPPLAFN